MNGLSEDRGYTVHDIYIPRCSIITNLRPYANRSQYQVRTFCGPFPTIGRELDSSSKWRNNPILTRSVSSPTSPTQSVSNKTSSSSSSMSLSLCSDKARYSCSAEIARMRGNRCARKSGIKVVALSWASGTGSTMRAIVLMVSSSSGCSPSLSGKG